MDKIALARNTLLQTLGKITATVLGVITVAFLARYLGVSGYGQLTIVLTFLSIFAAIVDFGLTLTTVQLISEDKAEENKIIGNLLSLRIISAIVFLSLAPICAIFFPYEQVIIVAIGVGAVSYLFQSTSQMLVGIFQKNLAMHLSVFAELLNRVIILTGAILAPIIGLNLVGIVWLFVIGNAIHLATMLIFSTKYIRPSFRFDFALWKKIIARSWPIGASIFFNLIYLRGDIVFMSIFRSNAEVGLYGAAYKIVDVITTIPVMYMGLVLPLLVAAWTRKQKTDFKELMQNSFDFVSILALPIIFGSIAVGVPLMELIAGPEFSESGRVLAILGPAAAIVFWNSLFGHAIVGLNKQKIMTFGYLAVAVITIAGYIIFIPSYGMWAAAWWTLIAETLIGLLTFAVVAKTSGYLPKVKMALKAALAAFAMFLLLQILPEWNVLIVIAIGAAAYYVALALLGGPNPKQIKQLFLPQV
ncbi:flippase [Patescibacteria group bacterium]|nr:flippase [Patescibacteria group bacterium]